MARTTSVTTIELSIKLPKGVTLVSKGVTLVSSRNRELGLIARAEDAVVARALLALALDELSAEYEATRPE